MITLDIVAFDAHGNAVSDLRAEDFHIFDAGQEQKVAYFRSGQDVTRGTMLRNPSNYSYGTFPHVTAVLFDQLNDNLELTGPVWDSMIDALSREGAEPNIYLYVLMKDGALVPVRALPESWGQSPGASSFWIKETLSLFDDMRHQYRDRPVDMDPWRVCRIAACRGSRAFVEIVKRMQEVTGRAIDEIAGHLATVPGTKSIVWFAPDPLLVVPNPTGYSSDTAGAPRDLVPVYRVAGPREASKFDNDTIVHVGVQETIEMAVASAEHAYRLGYYPAIRNWDNNYHRLRVACKRPGIQIHTRAGYKAVEPVDIEDDRRQIVPDLLAASPFDASTIRFTASGTPGHLEARFDLTLNAADLVFERTAGSYACWLAVSVIEGKQDGPYEAREDPLLVHQEFAPAEYEAALHNGVHIRLAAPMPGSGGRRIVVLDRVSDSFGTLTIDPRSTHP